MKFSVALTMGRFSATESMQEAKRNLLELVRLAEAGGFETVWTAEHHTIEFTISPNPFQTLVWLGQHTERIRLGTSTVVAPYWHPIRLAGEAAMCDHLTDGRLEFGIARGSYQYEFDRMADGLQQQKGGTYLKEILPAVKELWQRDYAHDGEFWSFPTTAAVPKPMQRPHPPIWVAARDPATFDWAVAQGASLMTTPLSAPPSEVAVLGEKFRKAVADHPEMPRPRLMMQRRTCLFEKTSEWEEAVGYCMDYGRQFENLFQNAGSVTDGFAEPVPLEAVQGRDNYNPENLRRNLMLGTPDEAIEKLMDYEAAGVDQFAIGMPANMPFEKQRKTLQLFVDEIMPVFAARESDSTRAKAVAVAGE